MASNGGEFKLEDLKQFAAIYADEFDRAEMHDKVLVLEVSDESDENGMSLECEQERLVCKGKYQRTCWASKCNAKAHSEVNYESESREETHKIGEKRKANADVFEENVKLLKCCNDTSAIPPPPKLTCLGKLPPEKDSPVTTETSPKTTISQIVAQPRGSQRRIFVHSSWLSLQSNFFHALFYSGMKESHLKEVALKIPKFEVDAHFHLIKAMYQPNVLDALSVTELLQILILADKYDAKFVFLKCKYVLATKVDSIQKCEDIYRVVKVEQQMVNTEDLVNAIQKFLRVWSEPLDTTWQTSEFNELSVDLITLLLSDAKLIVSCEDVIFHALMHWVKHNLERICTCLRHKKINLLTSNLLSVVRFEILSIGYLVSVVQHHPVAKHMPGFNELYLKAVTFAATPNVVGHLTETPKTRPAQFSSAFRIVQFHWKMPEKELLDALVRLESQPFWACGFRMQLSFKTIYSIADRYCVTVQLEVLNLKDSDFASFVWHLDYEGECIFTDQQNVWDDDYHFSKLSSKIDKTGSFKWNGAGKCELELIMRPCTSTVLFSSVPGC